MWIDHKTAHIKDLVMAQKKKQFVAQYLTVEFSWPFVAISVDRARYPSDCTGGRWPSPARLMGSETCPKAPSRAQPCPDPGHNR